jgi:DNA-binding SARP family transcriptional activator
MRVVSNPHGPPSVHEVEPASSASAPVALSLLGSFEVRVATGPVALPRAGQRLVSYLALQDRPVERAHVAGRLWLDATEQHAQASLRTALWRVRIPGHALVDCTAGRLALAAAVQIDLREFRCCAHRALRGSGVPDPDDLARLADSADLLPDWYDDWLVVERERLRLLRVLGLEALCDRFTKAGRHAEATQAGIAAVTVEPLRESAHRALMRAHLADGNRGEAIREYRLFALLLHRELGVRPSPQIDALLARAGAP